MPIEIRELHIRTIIDDGDGRGRDHGTISQRTDDRDRLIAECVEQVLEIVQSKDER
jgi:hypothetical protein